MLTTKTKPKGELAEPDFEAARERFEKAAAKYQTKVAAAENTKDALVWSRASDSDRSSDRLSYLRERVEAAYPNGLPRWNRLPRQTEDAADALEDAKPGYLVERELWQAACRRETTRIAGEMQPRHRAAVYAIAKAIEALSVAMSEEYEIRAELARVAPEPESALLPNAIAGLEIGSLADWSSPASQWARRWRKLGILR